MKISKSTKAAIIFLISLVSITSFARGGGGGGGGAHSLEFGGALATAAQDDLNTWIVANSGQQLGSGYEFSVSYQYRFSGSMFGLVFRPGYFTQTNTGATSASLTGVSFMPILRIYPLENSFIHFFMQMGMGFATLNGSVSTATAKTDFSGNAFGAEIGLGADFCFTDSHCMTIEGNYRYLPIVRSTTSNSTGTLGNNLTSTGELRLNNLCAQNTMSGIQGMIAYTLKF